jgi:hypothetical protein
MINRTNKIYTGAINGLARHDLEALKKNNKGVKKMSRELEDLQNNIYYFIKNLDDSSVGGASNFYITLLDHLQDLAQSLELISKIGYTHVNNNHKKLKYNQIKELKDLDIHLSKLFDDTSETFKNRDFERIGPVLGTKISYMDLVNTKIEKQVARTRTEESSPKNTRLYFSLLTESRDIIKAIMDLLELYYMEHDSSVEPARIDK